jgi:hypothetical protein
MHAALTPPFPLSGAGAVLLEAAIGAALVSSFWVTYPQGFAEVGGILAVLLLACWWLAYSLGVSASVRPECRARAKAALVVGACFGLGGLVLGFLGGPHVAGVSVWGVAAQFVALVIGRIACAT